jgi:hypothetical protein
MTDKTLREIKEEFSKVKPSYNQAMTDKTLREIKEEFSKVKPSYNQAMTDKTLREIKEEFSKVKGQFIGKEVIHGIVGTFKVVDVILRFFSFSVTSYLDDGERSEYCISLVASNPSYTVPYQQCALTKKPFSYQFNERTIAYSEVGSNTININTYTNINDRVLREMYAEYNKWKNS